MKTEFWKQTKENEESSESKTQNDTMKLRESVGNCKFEYGNAEKEMKKVCGWVGDI